MIKRVRREPVLTVQTVVAALVAFGLVAWTDVQLDAVLAVVALLFGGAAVQRSKVSPVRSEVDAGPSQ